MYDFSSFLEDLSTPYQHQKSLEECVESYFM